MKNIGIWACVVLLLGGCQAVKKQYKEVNTVDPDTVWETVMLTPEGVHYGIDRAGMSKHDFFRTLWLQKRSANSPYLYEKLQINLNCRDRQRMLLMRILVQNNEVISIQTQTPIGRLGWWSDHTRDSPFLKWQPIEADSPEDKLADKVCATPDKRPTP